MKMVGYNMHPSEDMKVWDNMDPPEERNSMKMWDNVDLFTFGKVHSPVGLSIWGSGNFLLPFLGSFFSGCHALASIF